MRNPPWTTDELILALDLYFRVDPLHNTENHPEIIALSELLNRLPIHTERPDAGRFRNPNGVYMKLCNFLRLDPTYNGAGLKAGSKKDEEVWNEYASDSQRLQQVAAAIKSNVDVEIVGILPEEDRDIEAIEGRILVRHHLIRERNRSLVREKKASFLRKHGRLYCEVCTFDFAWAYGALGDGFIECHHVLPLSTVRPGQRTRIEDLALVCANCHRMLHRGSRWPTMGDLRGIFLDRGTANPREV
jgi:5-methylcytosine-specific restriction enzyme A